VSPKSGRREDLAARFSVFLRQEYGVELDQLLEGLQEPEKETPEVPVSIFSTTLSTLETVIKYQREVRGLSFSAIGQILKRHPASLTTSYRRSLNKYPDRFTRTTFKDSVIRIPLSIFTEKLAPLEALVWFLSQDLGLRLCDIARIIHIDQRTAWTVRARARKKQKEAVL